MSRTTLNFRVLFYSFFFVLLVCSTIIFFYKYYLLPRSAISITILSVNNNWCHNLIVGLNNWYHNCRIIILCWFHIVLILSFVSCFRWFHSLRWFHTTAGQRKCLLVIFLDFFILKSSTYYTYVLAYSTAYPALKQVGFILQRYW